MSLYRLLPTPAQEAVLRDHCGHARYVWNLAVEQHSHWHPGRGARRATWSSAGSSPPARAEHPWLAAGSQTVQQQALRDFGQAMTAFFDPANLARRPSWRKAGRDEGFRIVGARAAVGRAPCIPEGRPGLGAESGVGAVPLVPRGAAGSEVLPGDEGPGRPVAYRLAAVSEPVPAPGNGQAVGIDRGVVVSAALSTGELLRCPGLTGQERTRLRRLQRRLARATRGSNRRGRVEARDRPAARPGDGPA